MLPVMPAKSSFHFERDSVREPALKFDAESLQIILMNQTETNVQGLNVLQSEVVVFEQYTIRIENVAIRSQNEHLLRNDIYKLTKFHFWKVVA